MKIYELPISQKAKFFLYTLREFGELEMTYVQLSELLEMNRVYLPAIINDLEEKGLITVERGWGRKPSVYKINF
ncbi:MarR family transcriptional regulator [Bacillus wiedmannii]|uniref:MarR family transcriptional regulator n=1 Tax=Bacillus wiedmannii TaxID=1890302 RepID=UPI000BF6E70E|nr:MarR family transcriptional regulator [Bacillus wiedmannii]PFZ33842.1 MarR family transcriptional regulator [Bacillus wiedmannii]